MFCRQCGAPITDKSKFCRGCGAQIGGRSKFCRSCGAPLTDKTKFCRSCGNPVKAVGSATPAPVPPTPTPMEAPKPVVPVAPAPVATPTPAEPMVRLNPEPIVRLSVKSETPPTPQTTPSTKAATAPSPQKASPAKQPRQKKKSPVLIAAILAIVLVLICVPTALLFLGNPDETEEHNEHIFIKETVIRQASCVEDGIAAKSCECGAEHLIITPAKGHTYGDWLVDKKATCSTAGSKNITCTVCQQQEAEEIPQLKHMYNTVMDEKNKLIKYTCSHCEDTFKLSEETEVDIYSPRYIYDCAEDYSFRVYCEKDEAYIRKHLRIIDAYFKNKGEKAELDYKVEQYRNSYWTISPVEPYKGGNIYIASRTGNVLFEDMAAQDMSFQIQREESEHIELAEGVKFLQAMEDANAGYYPYDLNYSETTETYWLSLKKADSLAVGDLVCAGDARSIEDVVKQTGDPDVFGEIRYIGYDENSKNYLVELSPPDISELFSTLDIYSTKGMLKDQIQFVGEEQIAKQSMQLLYQSEDFAKLMCSVQDTSMTYLAARGYTTTLASLKDFLKKIELDASKSQKPSVSEDGVITGKFVLAGEISIPITVSSDPDSEQLGDIRFYFEATISLDSLKILLHLEKQEVNINGEDQVVKAQIGTQQQITIGFTFGAEVRMSWAPTAKPYVLNTKTRKYHYHTCKHLESVKDKTLLEKLSAQTLFERIAKESITVDNECKTCLPVSSMMTDSYVLNTETKVIHLPSCKHAKNLNSSKMEISETPIGNLIASGYSDNCGDCNPSSRNTNSFSEQVLKTMQSKDLSKNLEEFKNLTKDLDAGSEDGKLQIAEIPFTITGLDSITFDVSIYFDFNLEATLEYNYKLTIDSAFGIYVTEDSFISYSDYDPSPQQNSISLIGKARVDVGMQFGINIHIIGLDKYCFADLYARVGVYAELHGALQHDFIRNQTNYAAAYFEAGLHIDLVGSARVAFCKANDTNFIPENMRDIPMLRYGYEKVYSGFTKTPDEIVVDQIFYDLDQAKLFDVKYYHLVDMKEGTDTLSSTGIQDKYTVEYKLKDGKHCRISEGHIFVLSPEISFTDELTIVITGADPWGKYRTGNTQYNLESAPITIRYDPGGKKTEIPDEAVELNHHRYYLFSLPAGTTYDEAVAHCEKVGGYPCTITTQEESDFVETYLKKQGEKSEIFFGLQYNTAKAKWKWENGEEFDYTDWIEGEDPTIYAALSIIDGEYVWDYTFQNTTTGGEMLILCEWGAYSDKTNLTPEQHMAEMAGHYTGWYTASQGITAGNISVYRTNALLKDEKLLKMYAAMATEYSRNDKSHEPQTYTAKDIRKIVENHPDEYIAIFTFGPLKSNPNVEEGMYTMKVSYDPERDTYSFIGSEWIQQDTYVFVDFKDVTIQGVNLFGTAYGPYGFFGSYSVCGEVAMSETELKAD